MDWSNLKQVSDKIKINGLDLQYASPELKNNRDLVKLAVNNEGSKQ